MFSNWAVVLVVLMAFAPGALAQNPVKLASGARFELMAAAGVGSIDQGTVLAGNGSMQRMNWIAAADQPRSYTCNFSVMHFGWTEIVVQFTPRNSGTVGLTLMGPWEQIAARYASRPNAVAFELLNEPKDAATTTVLNPIYEEAIRRIRLTNPHRTIFVGPGSFNSISQLSALRLPATDANLIVTVHSYDPFLFTHQGATWTGDATATIGVVYSGPPATPKQPTAPASNESWVVDWFNQYNALPAGRTTFIPLRQLRP